MKNAVPIAFLAPQRLTARVQGSSKRKVQMLESVLILPNWSPCSPRLASKPKTLAFPSWVNIRHNFFQVGIPKKEKRPHSRCYDPRQTKRWKTRETGTRNLSNFLRAANSFSGSMYMTWVAPSETRSESWVSTSGSFVIFSIGVSDSIERACFGAVVQLN